MLSFLRQQKKRKRPTESDDFLKALECTSVAVPHALEPTYAIACERTVDLSRFYDIEAVKEHRAEVMLFSDTYRARYRDAYRALSACGALSRQRREMLLKATDFAKLNARMEGILAREFPRTAGKRGSADKCFLGGLTYKGDICCFDTVNELCPRVYALCDDCAIGAPLLKTAAERAIESGERVLACMDADDPARIRHLLIPNRGLAFVTSDERMPYPLRPCRKLRFDAAAAHRLSRADKARLHFLQRLEKELRAEAQKKLSEAKSAHDALERVYHPYVDFSGVIALAHGQAELLRKSRP